MSLFAKREVRQWAPEPLIPPFPGVDNYGRTGAPSVDRAMQVSSVWACVNLLADVVSMMPLHGYTMKNGIRVPTDDPPLIRKPMAHGTTTDWVAMQMVSALLAGNYFGHIVRRDALGFPIQDEPLDPTRVVYQTQAGRATWTYEGVEIPDEDILHIPAYRMPGRRLGLSPIQYAASQINTTTAVTAFGLDFFNNGAHPSSVLTTSQVLTQGQALTAKERFMAAVKGREPALLSGDMKYQPIQVSPEESQFLATQEYGVKEIARVFRVPPEMIASNSGASMTYANVEQRALDFLTYSVQPWLTRLEAAYAQLLPGNRHVRFDTSVLTRTDYLTTIQAAAIGIASRQMTQTEARARRDEPPLTELQQTELDRVPLTITASGKPKSVKLPDPASEGGPA